MTLRRPALSILLSVLLATAALVGLGSPAQADDPLTSIRINEVESSGGAPGDWVELRNNGASPTDVSGLKFKDNDDLHAFYEIPAGTTIPAGGYFVIEEAAVGYGLGSADSARLFLNDGTTTVDSYSWTAHATATTYGRCPDGTGDFTTTGAVTKALANNCPPPPPPTVKINEVESSGGVPGDWIEIKNIGAAPASVGGLKVKDNDDAHAFYEIPAGTSIPVGGYLTVEEAQLGYGLGANDSARLFLNDGTTILDSYAWTTAASTSYARCPDGTGAFGTPATVTKGSANDCPPVGTQAIRFNEVESNGDPVGDFTELTNISPDPVDVSGLKFKDADDTHAFYAIPAGTTIAPGGFLVLNEAQFGFGLGAADSVRLFTSDESSLLTSYAWTEHAVTSYGRCPDGTGAFTTTAASTKGAGNNCAPLVRINEIEGDGGTPADWVEIFNYGAAPQDVSGLVVKDSDDAHSYVIPPATSIPGGGYLVLEQAALGFELDAADSVRLFASNGTTLYDSYSWAAHAATSFGRCPNGSGAFAETQVVTKGSLNNCPGDLITEPWPGGATVAAADVTGQLGGDISGLDYEGSGTSTPGVLWAVDNGAGALLRLVWNGSVWTSDTTNGWSAAGKSLKYLDQTGVPDTEGMTMGGPTSASGIYTATERNNSANGVSRMAILRYDVGGTATTLNATNEWSLNADLPTVAPNLGIEDITWVPDSYLTASGFLDQSTSSAYDPANYPNHGGGLFFVGLEFNGMVYAYALNHADNTYTRVATFFSGYSTGVMALDFEKQTNRLWVICDDTCTGRHGVFAVDTSAGPNQGKFRALNYYERPTGMPNLNNEGFTITPRSECVGGVKPVFWSDDSQTGGNAIRSGTLTCTERVAQTVAFTSTQPVAPTVGQTYAAGATGGASANPVVLSVEPTPAGACTIAAGTVTFAHAGTCVVRADQAGNDDFAPGSATQSITVGKGSQTVVFTSAQPISPALGQTYTPTATGGASGNPVTFSVQPTPAGVCTISGGTVTFAHAGTCVVKADQAGSDDYTAGTSQQSVLIGKASQAVVFTSAKPSPVVGETYAPTTSGGGSGNPVTFSVEPSPVGACSISGATVTFAHPGVCLIRADQAGTDDYLPGSASQSVTISKAGTVTVTSVIPDSLVATVSPVAPGAGTPTGQVRFTVDGSIVGESSLSSGTATLPQILTTGTTHTVVAEYFGDGDFTGSSDSATRSDPTISATVTPASGPPSAFGWYDGPVTVSFTCVANGSPLVGGCPASVTLSGSGGAQVVERSVSAHDGGAATAGSGPINIDRVPPSVRVGGVKDGKTYTKKPKATCKGSDALSGLATCNISVTKVGVRRYRVVATATDRAGNTTTATATYKLVKKR